MLCHHYAKRLLSTGFHLEPQWSISELFVQTASRDGFKFLLFPNDGAPSAPFALVT